MSIFKKTLAAAAVVSAMSVAGTANAFVLDFGVSANGQGGSINYDGTGPLVGTDINVSDLTFRPTVSPETDQNYSVFNGLFNFTTGDLSGQADMGSWSTWAYEGGGTVTLVGGVDLNGNGVEDAGDIASGSTLLTGTFTSAAVAGASNGSFEVSIGFFQDQKNVDLLNYFGLPTVDSTGAPKNYAGSFNISFTALIGQDKTFTSTMVHSGDIVNVPEPASALLLGGGLLGLAAAARRRKNKA